MAYIEGRQNLRLPYVLWSKNLPSSSIGLGHPLKAMFHAITLRRGERRNSGSTLGQQQILHQESKFGGCQTLLRNVGSIMKVSKQNLTHLSEIEPPFKFTKKINTEYGPKQLLEDKIVHNLIPHKGTTLQIVIEKHTMKNYTKRLHFVEQVSMTNYPQLILRMDIYFVHGEDTIGEFLRKVDSSSGLSHEELEKVPCFNLKIGEPSTCPICLDGYQDSELCRIFPACNHVFHVRCIDLWLVKRLTCPVCRAPFKAR
ncbi:hypothetical protein LguiB_031941 [Lonicera macranthoides]